MAAEFDVDCDDIDKLVDDVAAEVTSALVRSRVPPADGRGDDTIGTKVVTLLGDLFGDGIGIGMVVMDVEDVC